MGHCKFHMKCQYHDEDSEAGRSSIIEVNHHRHRRKGKEASVITTTISG